MEENISSFSNNVKLAFQKEEMKMMKRIKNFIWLTGVDETPMLQIFAVIGICVLWAIVYSIVTKYNILMGIVGGVAMGIGPIAVAIIFAIAVLGVRAVIMVIINACRKVLKK